MRSSRLLPHPLNDRRLIEAARHLGARDGDLRALLQAQGPPPLWGRAPGFETLVKIILEQQVSLASADAVFRRIKARFSPVTPGRLARAGETGLRNHGVTRQKAEYCVHLATALLEGRLDLDALERMGDDDAAEALTRFKGIGPWTAQIYLLMALRRPDVWPSGDLALVRTIRTVKRLRRSPTPARMVAIAEAWRPYRAVAARMLWQHYLGGLPGK
jgi:DNA-3-methyladenine glycosylase II